MARLVTVALFIAWWLLPPASVLGLRPPVLRGLGIVPIALLAVLLALRGSALQPLKQSWATAHQLQPWDESNARR
jgi:hypothetical protein